MPWYGLAIFTFFFVTARLPELFTEFGIYLALLGLVLRPQRLSFPPPLRWAVVFLLWAAVTAVLSVAPDVAGPQLLERLKALVIFFVVVNTLRTPQQLRLYILIILLAFLIYPARGTLQNYVTHNTVFGRAIWNKMYKNPNDLAAMTLLMLGLALAIATVQTQNRRVRLAAAAFVPVMLLIILLTQSRGAFIGLVFGFGPPLLGRLRKRPSIAGPVLVILCLIVALVPAALWHRLEGMSKLTSTTTIAQADEEGSARQRYKVLKTGLRIFGDHPVVGIGIGCYKEAIVQYAPELGPRDAHNTYLSLAAEMGIPGLLLWLGMVGSVLSRARRRRASIEADDRTIQALWVERAIMGFLVAGLFATYSGVTMFYLFLGMLWAATNMLGQETPQPATPGPGRSPVRRALRAR
jgi:putative inorganic carbon (HCO3(-)) transporter